MNATFTGRWRFTKERKQLCPRCQKRTFNAYMDANTNQHAFSAYGEPYGKCERINSCQYHLSPYEHEKGNYSSVVAPPPPKAKPKLQTEFLDAFFETRHDMHGRNAMCPLRHWIRGRFGADELQRIEAYYGLTSWQQDDAPGFPWTVHFHTTVDGRLRTAKLMRYVQVMRDGKFMCKRLKPELVDGQRLQSIDWLHNLMPAKPAPINYELYGISQLKYRSNECVYIVEGYKTAIVCALFMPDKVWLGADNLGFLKWSSMRSLDALRGRHVLLIPDADGLEAWTECAKRWSAQGVQTSVDLRFMNLAEKVGGGVGDLEDLLLATE